MSTKTRLEKEAKGNFEMAYCKSLRHVPEADPDLELY